MVNVRRPPLIMALPTAQTSLADTTARAPSPVSPAVELGLSTTSKLQGGACAGAKADSARANGSGARVLMGAAKLTGQGKAGRWYGPLATAPAAPTWLGESPALAPARGGGRGSPDVVYSPAHDSAGKSSRPRAPCTWNYCMGACARAPRPAGPHRLSGVTRHSRDLPHACTADPESRGPGRRPRRHDHHRRVHLHRRHDD